MNKLKQYERILEKVIIKFGITFEDRENALEVIEVIKENDLTISMINVYPEILKIKASKVSNIVSEFLKIGLPVSILEKNPVVIEKTNASRVNKIKNTIEKLGYDLKILEKYPEIIAVGKDTNIEMIVKVFEKKDINKKYFETAGDVLAYSDAKDVEKILDILEKNNLLKNVLKKNPKVFYQNTPEVVEDIIELYKNPREKLGLGILKSNLEILSETTKVRIQAIMNMLERHGITQKVLVKEPSIVYKNETKDIEYIINTLKSKNIEKTQFLSIAQVLAYDDLELKRLITKIDFYTIGQEYFGNILATNPELVINSEIKNIREYIEQIEKGRLSKDIVTINPNILIGNDAFTVEKIVNNLEKIGQEQYYVEHPEILMVKNPEVIISVYEKLQKDIMNNSTLGTIDELIDDSSIFIKADILGLENIEFQIDKIETKEIKELEKTEELKEEEYEEVIDEIVEENTYGDEENIISITNENEEIENEKVSESYAKYEDIDMKNITKYLIENNIQFNKETLETLKIEYTNALRNVKMLNQINIDVLNNEFVLALPYEKVEKNIDVLIENNLVEALKISSKVLIVNPVTLENRINYLKENNIELDITKLEVSDDRFNTIYNTTEEKIEEASENVYLAQEMIDSPYTDFLNRSNEILETESERQLFDKLFEKILDLGILKDFTYIKEGYSYSVFKIKRNLVKLIANVEATITISNLTKTDELYFKSLAIIGNKVMSEVEAEKICKAVITGVRELDKVNEVTVVENTETNNISKIDINEVESNNILSSESEESNLETPEIKEETLNEEFKLDEVISKEEETENINKIYDEIDEELEALLGQTTKEDEEIARLEREIAELEQKNKDLSNIYGIGTENISLNENENLNINTAEKEITKIGVEQDQNNILTPKNIENIEEKEVGVEVSKTEEPKEVTKIVVDSEILNEYKTTNVNSNKIDNSGYKRISTSEITQMKQKLESMSKSFRNFSKELSDREFEEEARKARAEKEKISEIIKRRQEKELIELRRKTQLLEEKRKLEEEKRKIEAENKRIEEEQKLQREKELLEEKIRLEAERIANEKLEKLKQENELKLKIEEEAQKLIKLQLEEENSKKEEEAKKLLELQKEKEEKAKIELELKEKIRKELEEKAKQEELLKKQMESQQASEKLQTPIVNIRHEIPNTNVVQDSVYNMKQTADSIDSIDNINSMYKEVTLDNINNFNQVSNTNTYQNDLNNTKDRIKEQFDINNQRKENGYVQNTNSYNNTNNQFNNPINPNANMQTNMENRTGNYQNDVLNRMQSTNNYMGNETFNRTINAYYNPNQKPFFDIDDYGYILNEVNDQELKRMQSEMNELYKREKNNGYYEQ